MNHNAAVLGVSIDLTTVPDSVKGSVKFQGPANNTCNGTIYPNSYTQWSQITVTYNDSIPVEFTVTSSALFNQSNDTYFHICDDKEIQTLESVTFSGLPTTGPVLSWAANSSFSCPNTISYNLSIADFSEVLSLGGIQIESFMSSADFDAGNSLL